MRRNNNTRQRVNNDGRKRTVIIVSCLVLSVVSVLLLTVTCSSNVSIRKSRVRNENKVVIVGPKQVSAESANFVLVYEDKRPVQNVYWNIIEGSQYATINHVTGELTLNSNAYNSNIVIQGIYNDQSSTFNVLGTFVEGKIVKTKINNETKETKIDIVDLPDYKSPDEEPETPTVPSPEQKDEPGITLSPGPGQGGKSISRERPPEVSHDDGQGKLAISISAFVVLLVSYIVARVKSKDGELVITANAIDKILILAAPVLCFVALFISECLGKDHELTTFQITLYTLSGLMLQGSIVFSIVANKGNALHIALSIMAKLFIFVLTIFLLFLLVVIFIITFMLSAMSHSHHEETYVVKYDHFLDQWVGYRVD